jgi:hypothetical protein
MRTPLRNLYGYDSNPYATRRSPEGFRPSRHDNGTGRLPVA